jgi:ParB family chromosome partitioning protein
MIKRMPMFSTLPVAEIQVAADRLRIVSEAKVAALMEVIPHLGFIGQITVRRSGKKNTLIDGAHRLEAMRRLGQIDIPVEVLECNQAEARQLEITGNLVSGMTPLQDAIFLAEWQKQYEELHPETKAGMAGALAKQGVQRNSSSFAETIAETRQITPRQVRKIIAAARSLSEQHRIALQKTPKPMPLKELEALAKISDPDERDRVVSLLVLGEPKTVGAARAAIKSEAGGGETPSDDEGKLESQTHDAALIALLKAWDRAPEVARRRFIAERETALSARLREHLDAQVINGNPGPTSENITGENVIEQHAARVSGAAK